MRYRPFLFFYERVHSNWLERLIEKIKPYRRICSRFEKLKQSLLQHSRFCYPSHCIH